MSVYFIIFLLNVSLAAGVKVTFIGYGSNAKENSTVKLHGACRLQNDIYPANAVLAESFVINGTWKMQAYLDPCVLRWYWEVNGLVENNFSAELHHSNREISIRDTKKEVNIYSKFNLAGEYSFVMQDYAFILKNVEENNQYSLCGKCDKFNPTYPAAEYFLLQEKCSGKNKAVNGSVRVIQQLPNACQFSWKWTADINHKIKESSTYVNDTTCAVNIVSSQWTDNYNQIEVYCPDKPSTIGDVPVVSQGEKSKVKVVALSSPSYQTSKSKLFTGAYYTNTVYHLNSTPVTDNYPIGQLIVRSPSNGSNKPDNQKSAPKETNTYDLQFGLAAAAVGLAGITFFVNIVIWSKRCQKDKTDEVKKPVINFLNPVFSSPAAEVYETAVHHSIYSNVDNPINHNTESSVYAIADENGVRVRMTRNLIYDHQDENSV